MSVSEFSGRLGGALLVWLVLATASGCATLAQKKQEATLDHSASTYATAVRWNNFQAAAAFLRFRDGSTPSLDLERLKSVRVLSSSYELVPASDDGTQARMIASFNYQTTDSASVRNITQQALWWFEPQAERWYLDSGLPAFE